MAWIKDLQSDFAQPNNKEWVFIFKELLRRMRKEVGEE